MDCRNKERWIYYGNDPADWFKSETVDAAICLLNEASDNNDQFCSESHFLLGVVYKEKGWFQSSENEFKSSIEKDINNIHSRLGLASLYVSTGRYYDAESQLHIAYQQVSDNPLIAKNLAFLYKYYLETPESALVWFNRFLKDAPKKDLDVNLAMNECRDLAERYPEFIPSGDKNWIKSKTRFKARK